MGVRDDATQLVEGVVQVVHSPPLAGVDAQAHGLALSILSRRTARTGRRRRYAARAGQHRMGAGGRRVVRGAHEAAARRLALRQTGVVLVERKSAVVGVELVVVASCESETRKINYRAGTQQRILMKTGVAEKVFFSARGQRSRCFICFV